MFRLALVLMLVAGLLAGVSAAGSAYFTDTATVDANLFSTGKIKITANPTTAALTLVKMAPGDRFVGPITIANDATDGDVDFTYLMSSSTTGDAALKTALQVEVRLAATAGACTKANFSSLPAAIASGDLGSSIAFTGGARTLNGTVSGTAQSEVLCFQVSLPDSGADQSALKNLSTTTTFTFVATSVPHNP